MKLFIPACGDRVHLTADWTFDLYLESRNMKFAETHKVVEVTGKNRHGVYSGGSAFRGELQKAKATLPAGTVLECDRVYIRTFSKSAVTVGKDFDSITWKVMKGEKPLRNSRFWCKLPDCYEIEFELKIDSLYRDRVKVFRQVHES